LKTKNDQNDKKNKPLPSWWPSPLKFIRPGGKTINTQLRTGYVQADFQAKNVRIVIPGQVSVMGW
jgi:hypothetical protein